MTDYAANLALFVLDQTGSIYGTWVGRMSAKQQRQLFGRYLGKGKLVINGTDETVLMIVSACFGMDWDIRHNITWSKL